MKFISIILHNLSRPIYANCLLKLGNNVTITEGLNQLIIYNLAQLIYLTFSKEVCLAITILTDDQCHVYAIRQNKMT